MNLFSKSDEVVRYDIGFEPEAAVSGPVLLQTDYSAFLTFNAVRMKEEARETAGVGIVEILGCSVTKFGYPKATIILETGTHSPWVSRLFEAAGHPVHVANARKLRAISKPPELFPSKVTSFGHCDLASACANNAITSRQDRSASPYLGFLPAPVTLTSPTRVRMEA